MIFMNVIIVSYRYFLRVTLPQAGYQIDLNASSKWYWPSRTSKTYDLLVQQKIYWAYKFSFNITRKNISLILSILPSFISKTFGDIIEGNYFNKNVPQCYWPCRIRWGLFLLAVSLLGEFLMALDQRFTVGVEHCKKKTLFLILRLSLTTRVSRYLQTKMDDL